MTYRILDLFCGAGGAAVGYNRAGFEVGGVDNQPQPRYPFTFVQTDALSALHFFNLRHFDAIHASPPCQDYSATKNMLGGTTDYPRLIGPVRKLLQQTGLPYIIENVPLARPEMRDPVKLCGSTFGHFAEWHGDTVYLQRHRLFETNFPLPQPPCLHVRGMKAVTVAGHGRTDMDEPRGAYFAGRGFAQLTRDVMGIDWMNRDELCEAIPPTYTEYVGSYLLAHLDSTSNRHDESCCSPAQFKGEAHPDCPGVEAA